MTVVTPDPTIEFAVKVSTILCGTFAVAESENIRTVVLSKPVVELVPTETLIEEITVEIVDLYLIEYTEIPPGKFDEQPVLSDEKYSVAAEAG